MRNLNRIYRIRLSDFEFGILAKCKINKIKPSNFIREAIMEKAERDLGIKIIVPF